MRVYFAPCGIGLGHVGRIIPIAKKLLDDKTEVLFSTYGEGLEYVEHEKLPLATAPSIDFQAKPDGTIDFKRSLVKPGPFLAVFTLLKQVNAEIKLIENFKPDVVVSDSRASSLLAAKILRIPRICILNQFQTVIPRTKRFLRLAKLADFISLTLIGKIWASANLVLIPDFPEPYTICAGNLNIPENYRKKVKLIGPIIEKNPNDLPSDKELRKKLKLPLDKTAVFVPISGPLKERTFLTVILEKIFREFPEEYEVVMSLGCPETQEEPIRYGNLTIHEWIPNRFEYLKACDLVLSRAGHGTITQCLCYGKPMILVPTPSHSEQLYNAQQAENLGVARIVPQGKFNRDKLVKEMRHVLDSDMQKVLKEAQKEVLENDGLKNAVKTILEMAGHKQVF